MGNSTPYIQHLNCVLHLQAAAKWQEIYCAPVNYRQPSGIVIRGNVISTAQNICNTDKAQISLCFCFKYYSFTKCTAPELKWTRATYFMFHIS